MRPLPVSHHLSYATICSYPKHQNIPRHSYIIRTSRKHLLRMSDRPLCPVGFMHCFQPTTTAHFIKKTDSYNLNSTHPQIVTELVKADKLELLQLRFLALYIFVLTRISN